MKVLFETERPLDGVLGREQASFSTKNRLLRVFWNLTYFCFFKPSPRILHRWRAWLLRVFGGDIGDNAHVYPTVRIWAPWNLRLGAETCLGDRVNCYSLALVSIGSRTVVSQDVTLCAGSHDYDSENFQLITKPIEIGADVWICAEAFIGPGVSIQEGAIIGARAVVVKDVPKNTVWAGNPARKLKDRKAVANHKSS